MNKREWEEAEQALKTIYGFVKLTIDGYEVTLMLERINTYKNGIMVYVNGKIECKWLMKDCEERRRFLRKREKSLMSPKQRESFKKMSKRMQRQYKDFYDRKYEYYDLYWTSFNSLKRHLLTNNESIEVIEILGCAV